MFFKKKKEKIELQIQEEIGIKDIISPASIKVSSGYIEIGEELTKTFFIFSYPRYLSTGWFSPIINLDVPMDISLFLHPIETGMMLKK